MNELKPDEAEKLFREISQAVHSDDSVKLSEIMTKQPPEVEDPAKEPPVQPEKEEELETPESGNEEDPPKEAGQDDESKPEEKEEEEEPEISDELAKLKEQLDKITKENHALKSNAGRVPQLQRRLHELDKKLEERSKQASPSSQTSTKIKPKVDELLKGVKDTDPQLAEAIAAAIEQAVNGIAEDSNAKELETLKFLRDQELQTHQELEAERLLQMYPNAPEVFASPSWAEWKKSQSSGIRALCESDQADDVSYAFEKYAADMKAKHPDLFKEEGKPEGTPNPAAAERAKQLELERQRKKETAVNVGSPSASGKVKMPDDPQALFDKYAGEIRKQRTGG